MSYNKERLRRATNQASNAIRRRAQINNGTTKHQSEESRDIEKDKCTKVITKNWSKTIKFLSQYSRPTVQYRDMSAGHVRNTILKMQNDNNTDLEYYKDMQTLINYINAITT